MATYRSVTVSSPEYLAENGIPETLEDLQNHVAVNYFWARTGRLMELTFEADGESVQVGMQDKLQ